MNEGLMTTAYIGAAILFILSLGGLSNPETSRRGNLFGMIGMAIAVLATLAGPALPGYPISPLFWRAWPSAVRWGYTLPFGSR
jgi:NAD/NADP transhydrogenase beta subunit